MLLHVLMFWGLLARPAGRSDWPAENYPVHTSRVMRKAGAARRHLAEKLMFTWRPPRTFSTSDPPKMAETLTVYTRIMRHKDCPTLTIGQWWSVDHATLVIGQKRGTLYT